MVRGSWRPNRTAIYWPPLLWPSALCLSRSPDAQPEAQRPSSLLDDGFLYWILSPTSLDPNSSGPQGPLWSDVAFPTTLVYNSVSNCSVWLLSWLSYIIDQRPLNHPLNLWNGMFDRHQAEITVMQFRGHSLPVYQSMSVSLDFLPCPISSANFRPRDFPS